MSDAEPKGFQLRELRLTGPGVRPASLVFTDGLNVIDGASDTGKSFAVHCIDFVLGAKDLPDEIPEASDYDLVFLQVEAADRRVFALKRALAGGQIGLFEGSLDEAIEGPDAKWQTLGATNKAKNSLSGFLLGLCGLQGKQVRRNKYGETQPVSFRVLAKALIVDEERIIAKRSPLWGTQKPGNTAESSTIRLLLTGHDDSAIVAPEDSKTAAGRLKGKKQAVEEMIGVEEVLLAELLGEDGDLEASMSRLGDLEHELARLSHLTVTAASELRSAEAHRRDLWNSLRERKDRSSELDGLLGRADLLAQHYQSDISRLEALAETAHVLDQYPETPCQLCGADPEHQVHEHGPPPVNVLAAAQAEAEKVVRLQIELRRAQSQMAAERESITAQVEEVERSIAVISTKIDADLSPAVREQSQTLGRIRSEYATYVRIHETFKRLNSLRDQLAEIPDKPAKREIGEFADLTANTMAGVSQAVAGLLTRWNLHEHAAVSFDSKSADILVNGRMRASHGKGVRAVMCAAYVIGLMQHAVRAGHGHPGFVVLDTPLNPYKAADDEDDGRLEGSVKAHFYTDLCETVGAGQVIVFENETPPESVRNRCNYVHFSGTTVGRAGLIPV